MGNLTARFVASAPAGRHLDGDGLFLMVKPSGAKSWLLRIQADGKRQEFGLGSTKAVTLADARDKAAIVRRDYRHGIDPLAVKRKAKAERQAAITFADAARTCHDENKLSWRNSKHRAQWLATLEAYAFPALGSLKVADVTGPMVRDCLLPIWLEKPETARRVKQRIGAVLDWAYSKGYRASEAPMRSIGKGLPRQPKKEGHFEAMPYPDVPAFMASLAAVPSIGRMALRFLILTAARSGEVRNATWGEIDLDGKLWSIPGERMKAGRDHAVPLSDDAVAILRTMHGARLKADDPAEIIFRGKGDKPLSDMTLTKVLRDGGHAVVTVHGFRSSFRDWAAECTAIQGEVVEAALAHTVANKVEAAYRRTNYLEKRRGLMDSWASFTAEKPANVIALRTAQ